MSKIVAYMPTYSPNTEADKLYPRTYSRLSRKEITRRIMLPHAKGCVKPWVYFDAIDSVLNTCPDIDLIVGDGMSTDSIRSHMRLHHQVNPGYSIEFYPEKLSQWVIFNDIFERYTTPETEYFVFTSSDIIWQMDWVGEAIKEFKKNPKLMMLFPTVSKGDSVSYQIAPGPIDKDPEVPPYDPVGEAPVLNAYAMIFRMDFLRAYGGYPTVFRNCYTESFLHFLSVAIGGEMRLLPRGWCFHWGEGDMWQQNGSHYGHNQENGTFQEVMGKVKQALKAGTATPEFFRQVLWKPRGVDFTPAVDSLRCVRDMEKSQMILNQQYYSTSFEAESLFSRAGRYLKRVAGC